jgi:hypothetical protein
LPLSTTYCPYILSEEPKDARKSVSRVTNRRSGFEPDTFQTSSRCASHVGTSCHPVAWSGVRNIAGWLSQSTLVRHTPAVTKYGAVTLTTGDIGLTAANG